MKKKFLGLPKDEYQILDKELEAMHIRLHEVALRLSECYSTQYGKIVSDTARARNYIKSVRKTLEILNDKT